MVGPNLKKLAILKMSRDAIPPGGSFVDGIKFLTTPGSLPSGMVIALKWCKAAIKVVREAPVPNPWTMATDEEIAGELLRQIDQRKAK